MGKISYNKAYDHEDKNNIIKMMQFYITIPKKILLINCDNIHNILQAVDESYIIENYNINNIETITLESFEPDLIIIDISEGVEILKKISNISFITICDRASFENAILSLQIGAYTCLPKPLDMNLLINSIKHALQMNFKTKILEDMPLIAKSQKMQHTMREIKQLKNAHIISFISPIGCGKKFIANYCAKLWNKQVYLIDCENINMHNNLNKLEYLITRSENKMFIMNHPEQLSSNLQTRLSNIIHMTIGDTKNQWVNIINADDEKNLIRLLYDRISIFNIHIPRLKERAEDIYDISKILQKYLAKMLNKKIRKLDINNILSQNWPGNFRQLRTYIEQRFYISNQIDNAESVDILIDEIFMNMNLKDATTLFEKIYLKKQIASKKGKIGHAAEHAAIDRTTLYRKLKDQTK